ncbi:nitrogen regulatory protein P-II family [Treponema bryantii]|jgi:nitrogen regulatory protein PII|uniref:Nitrogen regulatory protein P-II family n=1 Tax=Treponema bryantii TaxID=163 RepID=A0A1I3IAK6_9SPIR|nr:P-II family nitrogen regulator [Treponema bryantii]SFI44880.1 nitrogen regulatory protein P-II family [Treponema bryantii]
MSYKLLVSIVPHDSGELISNAAKSAGAGGGTIAMGRGTASNGVLQLLGLGDTSKDIVYIILEEEKCENVKAAIVQASESKKHFGVLFTLNVGSFVKAGSNKSDVISESKGEETMADNTYQMINVIVNKGYAEDAMAAARKAGAGGGTIISARGTAKEGDAAFFGMTIVPEKDMLMILVPSDKKDAIVNAITELPCFDQAGSGIIFCNEAQNFTVLGKK